MIEVPLALCLLTASFPGSMRSVDEYVAIHRAADASLVEGDLVSARRGFERCLELAPENPVVGYGLACVESRAGNVDASMEWLARAVAWGYADASVARWDVDLASIRSDPRFEVSLQSMADAVAGHSTGTVNQILPAQPVRRPAACAIAPTGHLIVVGYEDGSVAELSPSSLDVLRSSMRFSSSIWAAAWSHDGSRYAVLAHDGMVGVWIPAEERPVLMAPAFARLPSLLERFDEQFPATDRISHDHARHFVMFAESERAFGGLIEFDPTGSRLLVAGGDRGGSLWSREGRLLHRWEDPLGGFVDVPMAWSHDGLTIARAAEASIQFFDGKTGAPTGRSLETGDYVHSLALDPRGGRIATGHHSGLVRIWSLESQSLLVELFPHHPTDSLFLRDEELEVHRIEYSPDGKRLACTTGVGVYAIVYDLESQEQLWISEHAGGRMGEPADLAWSPNCERIWFAFASGVMDLASATPARGGAERLIAPGFVPTLEASGPGHQVSGATILGSIAVTVVDAADSYVRTMRVDLEGGFVLRQAPSGHFTTDAPILDGWLYVPDIWEDPVELGPHVDDLFDPKRVRASMAGVRLAHLD